MTIRQTPTMMIICRRREKAVPHAVPVGVRGGVDGAQNMSTYQRGTINTEYTHTHVFDLSGSTFLSQRKYDGGLSLPSKLPFSNAKALVKAMLDGRCACRRVGHARWIEASNAVASDPHCSARCSCFGHHLLV